MRQADALTLRSGGLPYSAIGRRLGITRQRVHQLVRDAITARRAQVAEPIDEVLALEISRLDGMLERLYPKAAKGDMQAIDRVLKIGERRAKLLGLDAPTRSAFQGVEDAPPIVSEANVLLYIPAMAAADQPAGPDGRPRKTRASRTSLAERHSATTSSDPCLASLESTPPTAEWNPACTSSS